jgi:hypothetical protein
MTQIKKKLFDAFQADHADLGKGLYGLRLALSNGDPHGARRAALFIDTNAGAHIAFEEFDFYPALKSRLSESEVAAMFLEHAEGIELISEIANASDSTLSSPHKIAQLLKQIDTLDHHVADCGDLFGAMGGLSESDYKNLLAKLEYWRRQAPRWSEIPEMVSAHMSG